VGIVRWGPMPTPRWQDLIGAPGNPPVTQGDHGREGPGPEKVEEKSPNRRPTNFGARVTAVPVILAPGQVEAIGLRSHSKLKPSPDQFVMNKKQRTTLFAGAVAVFLPVILRSRYLVHANGSRIQVSPDRGFAGWLDTPGALAWMAAIVIATVLVWFALKDG
jgi:hypothetical protein